MGGVISSFKDLKIWQKGIKIVKLVYVLSEILPKKEEFVLSQQMRRAAISIPANISEGYRRSSKKEYQQYLHIALASSSELQTFVCLCRDLYAMNEDALKELESYLDEFQRMTVSLIHKLK